MVAEDQGVDVVRPLVGVDRLQVDHVAEYRVVASDPVRPQDVPRLARRLQRQPDVVLLEHGDVVVPGPALVLEPPHLQRQQLPLADLGQHPDQFLLHKLMRGDGLVGELLALLRVVERGFVAFHRRPEAAPADPVARLRQAIQRRLQPLRLGQLVAGGDAAVVHRQAAGDGSPQRVLVVHVPGFEALGVLLHQVTANLAAFILRPHQRHVGDGAVGDPELLPVQQVGVAVLLRGGQHPAGVRAEPGLGQPEAPNRFRLLQPGQPFFLLRLRPVGIDGPHHQRRLHRNKAAQPRIAPLQLLHHQPVFDVRHLGAAVALQIRPKVAQLPDLGDQLHRESGRLRVLLDDGLDLLLHPLADGGANDLFVVAQLRVQLQKIDAMKRHAEAPCGYRKQRMLAPPPASPQLCCDAGGESAAASHLDPAAALC